jgi:hypothetical protein
VRSYIWWQCCVDWDSTEALTLLIWYKPSQKGSFITLSVVTKEVSNNGIEIEVVDSCMEQLDEITHTSKNGIICCHCHAEYSFTNKAT